MIQRKTGRVNVVPSGSTLKKASTAFTVHGLVLGDGSGYLTPANATSDNHIGLNFTRTVVSTDADYATANYMAVDLLAPGDICEADVSAGTASQANMWGRYDLNSTGDKVDLTSTTNGAVVVVGIVSATKVLIIVNSLVAYKNT